MLAAFAAFFMFATPALAQATTDTTLSVPIGSIVGDVASYLALGLAGVVVWGLRFLPPQLYALAMTTRVDQLLTKAISYGLNVVRGASQDKVLTIDVGNLVLKEALAFALTHGPSLLKSWAGEPLQVAEKLWARLDLPADSQKPDFRAIIAEVKLSLPGAA